MPYLDPELVVGQFSKYLYREVREAIEDDEKFVAAQVGSMSSSMNFLSRELGGAHVAVNAQRRALLEALDDVEGILDEDDVEGDGVRGAVSTARERVDSADGGPSEVEGELTAAATAVLDGIDEDLDGDAARRVRRPLYDYMETRVQTQLDLLR